MSMSSNSSQSTSTPVVTQTPENLLIDQISGVASGLANQMYGWAQGVFAQTSQITNQAVGNFFNVSQNMLGLSNNLTNQYNNLFAPENAQLVAEANSYASPARMAVNMGQAGATAAQAGDAALRTSEEALRSYGINPSDGRYAALDKAAAVQNAANVAGAENTQRNADIATGQRLRSEAVQVGAQLPAAIANVNNTAIQANTGASNASLANANTGKNLMSLPNEYLSTAMGVKLPLQGQQSQSTSSGFSSSPSRPSSPSGGGGGGGGGAPSGNPYGPSGPAWMPQHTGFQSDNTGMAAHGGAQPNSGILTPNWGGGGGSPWSDPTGQNYDPMAGITSTDFTGQDPNNIYQPDPFGATMNVGDPNANAPVDYTGGSYQDPFASSGFGQTYDTGQNQTFTGGAGAQDTQYGNINYDPNANQASGWGDMSNYGGGSSDPFTADNSGYDPNANWGNGADQYSQPADTSSSSYDTSSPSSDYYAGDNTSDPSLGLAHGGPIPATMSPSGGRQTDDISARGPGGQPLRMNANEFVIPQDVALWKGQEFFQNLIDQSRKRRMTASAKPAPMPMR